MKYLKQEKILQGMGAPGSAPWEILRECAGSRTRVLKEASQQSVDWLSVRLIYSFSDDPILCEYKL